MASLTTSVAGLELDCCIYNASGPRTGLKGALEGIAKSSAGAVLSKSATLIGQTGNPNPRYKEVDLGSDSCPGSINSEGLPNKGIDYYIAEDIVNMVNEYNKPYIISLSGLKLKDNLEMFRRAMEVDGIAAIELNLACPNVPGNVSFFLFEVGFLTILMNWNR